MTGNTLLKFPWLVPALLLFLACFRLCHAGLLWADEDYHLAAAIHILNGKIPYRDFWYDKPPLSALYYLLIGGSAGWPLRILDASYILLACSLAYGIARDLWDQREGLAAALLFAFFTTFYLPSAVISFAPDALMMVPHLAAVYFALNGSPLKAGLAAGIGFLVNTKAVFVLIVCAVFLAPEWITFTALSAGFCLPLMLALAWALGSGAWPGYLEQVWQWGLIYAQGSPVLNPWITGLSRTANWIGFHFALVSASIWVVPRLYPPLRWRLIVWIALSFVGVALGTRFAPHYYLQLLPPLTIAASRGVTLALSRYPIKAWAVLLAFLLIPLARFGPRYVSLAADLATHRQPQWTDAAMDLDSQLAAEKLRHFAHPGDTLFVWGYRPNLYVYTRLSPDSRFVDSQPLTGVPADRHLSAINAIYSGPAALNRRELALSRPTYIVDGLSPFNPRLSPSVYPELRAWIGSYKLIDRTPLCLIYQRQTK